MTYTENSREFTSLLEEVIKGLMYLSADSYPFEVVELGDNNQEFIISKLLLSKKIIGSVEQSFFLEDVSKNLTAISQYYIELIKLMIVSASSIEILKITLKDLKFQNSYYPGVNSFYVILGQLNDGLFAGISAKLDEALSFATESSNQIWISLFPGSKVDLTEQIKIFAYDFEKIREQVHFPSFEETKEIYPFDDFILEFADSKSYLIAKALHSTGILCIDELCLDDLILLHHEDKDYREYHKKMSTLINLLNQYLTDIKVYNLGIIEILLFIIGVDDYENLIGVSTTSIQA
jgi:Nuclease A inhibitor-like protein